MLFTLSYTMCMCMCTRNPWNFYCLLGIHTHLSSKGYQKYTSQTALSTLLFQDVMVQLTVSHPILPTSSSLQLTIIHHTLRIQNIYLASIKIFHNSQPMHSWSQRMSLPYTQTFNMMMAYQPSFISWRNNSIFYPKTAHFLIQFTQSSISFLNIAPSISWTHTSTRPSAPPWEQGWLSFHVQRGALNLLLKLFY